MTVRLRHRGQFVDHMKGIDQLKQMREGDRDKLFTELHQLAKARMQKEGMLQREQTLVPNLRAKQTGAFKAIGLLEKSLSCLRSAEQICNQRFIAPGAWHFTVDVEKQINATIASISEFRRFTAVRIHPKHRNRAEKELAGGDNEIEFNSQTREFYTGRGSLGDYPIGKATGIDQWFIGEVDRLLFRYHLADGRTIPRHDIIISGLFEAAFGEGRHEADSIRMELRRQKQKGIPQLVFMGSRLKRLPRVGHTKLA